MSLYTYLSRLYDTITSRQEIEIESLEIQTLSIGVALFVAMLRFVDGSHLMIEEEIEEGAGRVIEKIRYKYHHQDPGGRLIFRYDNAPHHPEAKTFPHHKHDGAEIVEAGPVDLSDVLREIDRRLYPPES